MIIVVDIFNEIVERTAESLDIHLNYMHGHPLEITSTLTELTKNQSASAGKYPLVALFQDFEETMGGHFISLNSLQLIIATLTDKNYLAAERYERNFIPTLYPIYEELMLQIAKSTSFRESTVQQITHTKIDRLYWGRNGLYGNSGNIFNDHIDAIEIKNLKLNAKLKTC